jgi:hypothetical protein
LAQIAEARLLSLRWLKPTSFRWCQVGVPNRGLMLDHRNIAGRQAHKLHSGGLKISMRCSMIYFIRVLHQGIRHDHHVLSVSRRAKFYPFGPGELTGGGSKRSLR